VKAIEPPPLPEGWQAPALDLPRALSRGRENEIWFVRHGEVARRWHALAYGCLDVELSEHGREQTQAMAEAFAGLEIARVLSSDLSRARLMGESIAAATGAPLTLSDRLREMNRGDWQGLDKGEFTRRWQAQAEVYWSQPYTWHVPGGEGDQALFERAYPELDTALEASPGGRLVVTAHGQLIRVLISRFLGLDVPASYAHYPGPARATCLVDGEGGWRLGARDRAAHELLR